MEPYSNFKSGWNINCLWCLGQAGLFGLTWSCQDCLAAWQWQSSSSSLGGFIMTGSALLHFATFRYISLFVTLRDNSCFPAGSWSFRAPVQVMTQRRALCFWN